MTEWIMIVEECGSHIFKLFFRDNIDWLHTQTSQKSSRSQTCFGTWYAGDIVGKFWWPFQTAYQTLQTTKKNFEKLLG